MDFSIIITTYNSREGAARSIESALGQKYNNNFEIIIIDDGSIDGTLEICQSYASRHSNIILLAQKNSGVSVSRNRGIKEASGKYVIFIDADDELLPDALSNYSYFLSSLKSEVDIVFSKFILKTGNNIQYETPLNTQEKLIPVAENFRFIMSCFLGQEGFQDSSTNPCFSAVPWAKCYSREFLTKNSLLFNKTLRRVQDLEFNIRCISAAEYVGFLDKETYIYEVINNSLSHKYNPRLIDNYVLVLNAIYDDLLHERRSVSWNDYYYYVLGTLLEIIQRSDPDSSISNRWLLLKRCFGYSCYDVARRKIKISSKKTLQRNISVLLCKFRMYYLYAVLSKIKYN